jgi:hypothetical protein
MKSLEISKSKTTSAKRMPLSAAYELIVVPAFNECELERARAVEIV